MLASYEEIITRLDEGIEKQQYIVKRSDTELNLLRLEEFKKTLLTPKNQTFLARLKNIEKNIQAFVDYIKILSG